MEEFKGTKIEECHQGSKKVENQIWESWQEYLLWKFHCYIFWYVFFIFLFLTLCRWAFLASFMCYSSRHRLIISRFQYRIPGKMTFWVLLKSDPPPTQSVVGQKGWLHHTYWGAWNSPCKSRVSHQGDRLVGQTSSQ